MAKLSITVLGERVLVKPLDAESTSGGIYLPEAAQEKPQRGEIIAIGTAQTVDADEGAEFDAKVGDVVEVAACRRMSKMKCWRLTRIIRPA